MREKAIQLAAARSPTDFEGVILDLQRFCRDGIRYVEDAGGREEFATSDVILRRAYDDCDGKAKLFVALVRALGAPFEARIRPVFAGPYFVHVQAEARWPGAARFPYVQQNGWVMVEVILADLPLGADPDWTPKDAAGRYRYI